MQTATTHIMFGDSGAGVLLAALRRVGRDDTVISFSDNLGFGPIDPPDPVLRIDWMKRELGPPSENWERLEHWEWLPAATLDFWNAASSASGRRVVWMSRRSVQDYSGFLEWVRRLGDETYDVVDLTEATIVTSVRGGGMKQVLLTTLGEWNPDRLDAQALLDQAQPLSAEARDRHQSIWSRLRAENAPLRVIADGALVSAPIFYWDNLLLTSAAWQKAAWVVGHALASSWEGDFMQVGDFILHARLRALVATGRLEARGNVDNMHGSEVRLPPAHTSA